MHTCTCTCIGEHSLRLLLEGLKSLPRPVSLWCCTVQLFCHNLAHDSVVGGHVCMPEDTHMFMCTATNWSRAWTVACTEVSVSRWRNAERWWEVDHDVPSEWRARCWCKHWLRYVASLTLNYDCKTCQRSGIWRMHNHMLGQTCYVYRHEATTPLCTEMQWSKCVCAHDVHSRFSLGTILEVVGILAVYKISYLESRTS